MAPRQVWLCICVRLLEMFHWPHTFTSHLSGLCVCVRSTYHSRAWRRRAPLECLAAESQQKTNKALKFPQRFSNNLFRSHVEFFFFFSRSPSLIQCRLTRSHCGRWRRRWLSFQTRERSRETNVSNRIWIMASIKFEYFFCVFVVCLCFVWCSPALAFCFIRKFANEIISFIHRRGGDKFAQWVANGTGKKKLELEMKRKLIA